MAAQAAVAQDDSGESVGVDEAGVAGDDDAAAAPREHGFVMTHNVQVRLNPLGLSLLSDFGYRLQLFADSDSMLLQNTRVDFGVSTRVTPAYIWAGPYIEATPVAFLTLRVAMRPLWYFGYYGFIFDGFESRDAQWDQDALDDLEEADVGERTYGLEIDTSATLQLKVGPIAAIYENRYTWYWMQTAGQFYYEPSEDFLLERDDAIWSMTATLGYIIGADPADWFLLVAPRYERHVSRETDFTRQQLGGLLLWKVPRDWIAWGEPRVALLVMNYLEHAMRDGGMYLALQISFYFQ
jgi:hypothetical protein